MNWQILGLEPTKDKSAITNAYRQKLRQTNPEDKPEEFKALRSAYEEAMAYANDQAGEQEKSPIDLWIADIAQLYENFQARIDPECWRAQLQKPICMALDTRAAAEEALLLFLLEHYYLPKSVWQLLEDTFSFSLRTEELNELWPREFVHNMLLMGPKLDPVLPYELFHPGRDGSSCDFYRKVFMEAIHTPAEQLAPLLSKIDGMLERHPYGILLFYRYESSRLEAVWERDHSHYMEDFRKAIHAFPEDSFLPLHFAEIRYELGDIREAMQMLDRVQELEPDSKQAGLLRVMCLIAMEKYKDAKKLAESIMRKTGSDPVFQEQLLPLIRSCNEALILQSIENPQDADHVAGAVDLAWCYMQNDRMDEALEVAQKIPDEVAFHSFACCNLMGKLHHNRSEFSQALPYLERAEQLLRAMQDDTEENKTNRNKLPEILQLQGFALMQLKDEEGAKEKFRAALEEAPENTEVLFFAGRLYHTMGEHNAAVEVLERLHTLSPTTWAGDLLLAMSLYRLCKDREAMEALDRAIAIQSGDLAPFLLRLQILVRNKAFDQVHALLEYLEQGDVPENIGLDLIRAELLELEEEKEAEALEQYRALEQRLAGGEDSMLAAELYYRLAVLSCSETDFQNPRQLGKLVELADRGLALGRNDIDLLFFKAWLLQRTALPQTGLDVLKEIEALDPHSIPALRSIVDFYMGDIENYAPEGLAYCQKLLELQKSPDVYYFAGSCKHFLGDPDGAIFYYRQELELSAGDIHGLQGMAQAYESKGNNEKALSLLQEALQQAGDDCEPVLVEHMAKLLRRMGRWEEAHAFIEEAGGRYGYDAVAQMQFQICCQVGAWEQAQQALKKWKAQHGNSPELAYSQKMLQLLQHPFAQRLLPLSSKQLSAEQQRNLQLYDADLKCRFDQRIRILSQMVQREPGNEYAMLTLAHTYWLAGERTAAAGAAAKALAMLDRILQRHLDSEALYRGRRSLALALLGRKEEAYAELEKTRALPLCAFCEYCGCKDADIYEANLEEILGDPQKALQLYEAGAAKWPDDTDLYAGIARLKRKGNK